MPELDELPRQALAFFAEGDCDLRFREQLDAMLKKLGGERAWLLGAPKLLDEVFSAGKADDEVKTLGGVLEMLSARPPNKLPIEIDRRLLEEVEALVDAVGRLSADTGMVFSFQLDDTFVGAIEAGKVNTTLQVGLLDEWRRMVR